MKKLIIIFAVLSFSLPLYASAAWSINVDSPDCCGSLKVRYFNGSYYYGYYTDNGLGHAGWRVEIDDSNIISFDQQSITDAYDIDNSPLPTNVNGSSAGLDWSVVPCDWSQYFSCAPPPPPTPTYNFPLGSLTYSWGIGVFIAVTSPMLLFMLLFMIFTEKILEYCRMILGAFSLPNRRMRKQ